MIHVFKYNTPEGLIALNVDNEDDAQNLKNDGAIEISVSELAKYGLIGKEHLISPATTTILSDGTIVYHEPSKEEQLSNLDSQYNTDKAELTQYFAEAILADDTEAQAELRQELEDLNADYIARRKEIEEG
jgi:hypothetical protein